MQTSFHTETHFPEANTIVGDFVSGLIWGEGGQFERFATMAVTANGQLQAGIVYHNYQYRERTVEISCGAVSRKWMSRKIIKEALDWAFDRLQVQAVIARHSEEAKHIRHIWTKLGAEEYRIPRLRGKNEPAEVVSVLTDDAWASSPFNVGAIPETFTQHNLVAAASPSQAKG